MQSIIIDQEFKNLIPPLSAEEKTGLESMIVQDGCREPLITWGGVIVDGHNRFEICTRLSLPYETTDKFFTDRDAVVEWIINNQFSRRNLALYDRTKLALRLEEVYRARAKHNQQFHGGTAPGKTLCPNLGEVIQPVNTLKEIAKIAQVGHGTVSMVKTIEEKATPEEKAALSAGTTTINKVYTGIKAKEQPLHKKGGIPERRDMEKEPYSNAMQFSQIAISQLERIREEDPKRVTALLEVRNYINQQLMTTGE